MADDTPYLLRGLQKMQGSTTLLSSTSNFPFLPRLHPANLIIPRHHLHNPTVIIIVIPWIGLLLPT